MAVATGHLQIQAAETTAVPSREETEEDKKERKKEAAISQKKGAYQPLGLLPQKPRALGL